MPWAGSNRKGASVPTTYGTKRPHPERRLSARLRHHPITMPRTTTYNKHHILMHSHNRCPPTCLSTLWPTHARWLCWHGMSAAATHCPLLPCKRYGSGAARSRPSSCSNRWAPTVTAFETRKCVSKHEQRSFLVFMNQGCGKARLSNALPEPDHPPLPHTLSCPGPTGRCGSALLWGKALGARRQRCSMGRGSGGSGLGAACPR